MTLGTEQEVVVDHMEKPSMIGPLLDHQTGVYIRVSIPRPGHGAVTCVVTTAEQRAGTQRHEETVRPGGALRLDKPWWQSNAQNMEPGPLQKRWYFPGQTAGGQSQSGTGQESRGRAE